MHDRIDEPFSDSLDGGLDAGLRVAFGVEVATPPRRSIVASLEETLGIHPRILLRDARDDATPVAVAGRAASLDQQNAVGRYQVAGEIARGGVGVVLKGRDPDLGRDVAIKVLRPEHGSRPGMVERFIEEAQIAAQLQHPGVLPVYELGIAADRRPFFAMKLIKGRTLAALLAERTIAAPDDVRFLGIFQHVCQAVAYAHAKGVVHRDLKPSNVMVGAFGEVQVVDWGLAKVMTIGGLADERGEPADASLVETLRSGPSAAQSVVGAVMGTPAYMSPEQARGETDLITERSDVFSLGAMLCEILTGAPPFAGDRHDALRQTQDADLTDANARLGATGIDPELARIARRCLAAKPAARPRDAGVIAEQISAHLAMLAERARAGELEAARSAEIAKGERRARRLTLALASVILLAVCAVSGGLLWISEDRRSQESARAAAVNEAVEDAAQLLGRATAASVGENEPWIELDAAVSKLESRLAAGSVDSATHDRAASFLQQVRKADRDRRIIEKIEDVVIAGASHEDKDSWMWMERELRGAFLDYGIDLGKLTPKEAGERIRESDLAAQLADGLELWIATCAHLVQFGVKLHPEDQLWTWTSVLYEADPDPFATAVRKLVYSPQPTREEVGRLVQSADFTRVRPRTLSWLAAAAYRTGDVEMVKDISRRSVLIYPDDVMLNFDHAYNMMYAKEYERAIRSYERCLAIRPHSAGIWRCLGIALRKTNDLPGSLDALRRSIDFQPDHAPTHVDLGLSLEAAGDRAAAIAAYEQALNLNPQLESAKARLEAARSSSADNSDPQPGD